MKLNLIEQEVNQLPLFLPVFLALGVLLGVYFPFCSFAEMAVACISCVAILSILLVLSKDVLYKFFASYLLVFFVGIYCAHTGGLFKVDFLPDHRPLHKNIDAEGFRGVVEYEEAHPSMKGMRRIILKDLEFKSEDFKHVKRVQVTVSKKVMDDAAPGDYVSCYGNLWSFGYPATDSSFDPYQYYSLVGIDATGLLFKVRTLKSAVDVFGFQKLRYSIREKITHSIKGREAGLATALVVGDKSSITQDIRDSFIKAGTAHILAISGLHMGILISIVYFVLHKFLTYLALLVPLIRFPRKVAAVLTIPIAFLYLGVSGFAPSAERAFLMSLIFLISIIMDKKAISLRNVSIAAFLLILLNPASLFLISFQLSFSAVICLISFYETFSDRIYNYKTKNLLNKVCFYFALSLCSTIIATVATAPFAIYTFNRFSMVGLLGNLIAIPMVSFIIAPIGILALLFGSISQWLADLMALILECFINVQIYISNLPGSEFVLRTPHVSFLWLIAIGGLVSCFLKTKLKYFGIALVSLAIASYPIINPHPDLIFLPGSDVVCVNKGGTLYVSSKQKQRNQVTSIKNTLGISGITKKLNDDIQRYINAIELPHFDPSRGLFVWSKSNKFQTFNKFRRHPYRHSYYVPL